MINSSASQPAKGFRWIFDISVAKLKSGVFQRALNLPETLCNNKKIFALRKIIKQE